MGEDNLKNLAKKFDEEQKLNNNPYQQPEKPKRFVVSSFINWLVGLVGLTLILAILFLVPFGIINLGGERNEVISDMKVYEATEPWGIPSKTIKNIAIIVSAVIGIPILLMMLYYLYFVLFNDIETSNYPPWIIIRIFERKKEFKMIMSILGFAFLILIGQGVVFLITSLLGFILWFPPVLIINVILIAGIIVLYFPFKMFLDYKAHQFNKRSDVKI
ncbi:MAG: hypothetical protein CL907_04290 [Dehalococcoidia bacterium]|nr:hypothetical protein [Dehalococcoidia bacterium]|tara:strand:+ start:132 stop:782 length:651 start_codon:yes stop_codon:yes gene_type:complete